MTLKARVGRARITAIGVAAIAAGTAVPFVLSDVSAASTASPAAGTIHISYVNTSIEGRSPGPIVISGAFADHGVVEGATLDLSKGTITTNISKLNALYSSSSFSTNYPASCSFSGAGNVTIPLVSGTGAYAGIKGDLNLRATFAAQGAIKHGKCDANGAPVADQQTVIGSGRVSF